ncbi:MAG: hydrogenase maturation protease [Betaproteobacteria bacterium]|nr:hydrogenase maturation protease [Betaproteobacteria bacterium]
MSGAVAIFAVGNRSRGDDAVGPLLLDRLRVWLDDRGLSGDFELFEEYQLQVENALDLEGRRLALFIDACRETTEPVTFGPVGATALGVGHSTHSLSPGAVLGVYPRVTGEAPPAAFVLGIRAAQFDLGSEPAQATSDAMEAAWALLCSLCRCPSHAEWQTMATIARTPRTQIA